jgi:hypothetical protein
MRLRDQILRGFGGLLQASRVGFPKRLAAPDRTSMEGTSHENGKAARKYLASTKDYGAKTLQERRFFWSRIAVGGGVAAG